MTESIEVLRIGTAVHFHDDPKSYTIKAISRQFAICVTDPCPDVWYTIIDIDRCVRGPNDLVFNVYDYAKAEDIEKCMADLVANAVAISRRKQVALIFRDIA